jgi:hypothetical protein
MALAAEQLFADSGALLRICGDRRPGGDYGVLQFVFPRGTLTLSCNADSDEVLVSTGEDNTSADDLSADPALAPLIGKVIESAWSLLNHRGYKDGFQIRFLDLKDRSETTCQFEAAAATLWLRNVV